MSHIVLAYHLYLAAMGALLVVQGIMYNNFKVLVLSQFISVQAKNGTKMMRKLRRIFLAYSKHIFLFFFLLCTLFYILYCLMFQDVMLTLSAVTSGQCCACIWQFCKATLESWATLFTGGRNDVEWDQMQAKMHLYIHISAYI